MAAENELVTNEYEVCEACYLTSAKYDSHELGYTPEREPLRLLDGTVMPGGESSDPEGDGDKAAAFSRFYCPGCDSPLAGARYYVTEIIEH